MTILELKQALDQFPDGATIKCGLSIPNLYINSVANMSISGDGETPESSSTVRLIAAAPTFLPGPLNAENPS